MAKAKLNKTFSLRIDTETYEQLKTLALQEERSVNYMALKAIKELIAKDKK